jgi:uncharacterized membrane protein
MSEALRVAFTVSAVLTGVLLSLDLIALLEFRYHLIAWMKHQEAINRLLRMRVEKLERLDGAANSPPDRRTECGECLTDAEREAIDAAAIGESQNMGYDEWYCPWYRCPKCKQEHIARSFLYCPDCGVKLQWQA